MKYIINYYDPFFKWKATYEFTQEELESLCGKLGMTIERYFKENPFITSYEVIK